MLFQDTSLATIRSGIAQLRELALKQEDEMREKLRDFYYGRQFADEYLAQWGFKRKDGKTDIPKGFCNITKKVIDKISLVYKYAPERYLDQEAEDDVYEEWLKLHPDISVYLKYAERQMKLLGNVLYRPVFNGKTWLPFIETEYEAHFIKEDFLHPFAYSWCLKHNTNSKNPEDVKDEKFVWWDAENYFFFDSQGRITYDELNGVNPFGIIPFVELMDGVCIDQYPAGHGAVELVQANEQINVALMDLNMMIHFQAFDQPYAAGVQKSDAEKIEWGPNKLLYTPENATIGLLGFNPKIEECVQAIQSYIETIAWTYNLNVDWAIEGAPSGFSLLVKNIDLLEARHDDVELAESYEKKLYTVISTMQNYYGTNGDPKLPLNATPIVDFQEIDFPINQKEELDRWDWEIQRNAASVVDYIQSKEDLSEEEAIERFNRNKRLNGTTSWREKLQESIKKAGGEIKGAVKLPTGDVVE